MLLLLQKTQKKEAKKRFPKKDRKNKFLSVSEKIRKNGKKGFKVFWAQKNTI